jgi:hypothetical protein
MTQKEGRECGSAKASPVCRCQYNRDILTVNSALLVEVEKALEFVNENLKMQLGQAFLSAVQPSPLSTPHSSCPGTHLAAIYRWTSSRSTRPM